MANFKCKMCGAQLDVQQGQTIAVCSFCGSKQTVANANDERKENLFNRANALRLNCEFDKAILSYQSILSIFPNEPEAYWGVCLCKYGIEYVDDPVTKRKKPTIHRVSFESILKDSDYLSALANADVIAKEEYQAEAQEIADIQKNILSISQKEEPFDIFICYKESDEKGKRTPDSVMAHEIYNELTEKGYKVFFARVTLESKLGSMYEPYIFAALNSAKIMLVIGTKKEYFEAVWVKNEWSRFIDLMRTRPDHYLIPCYKDMDAYEMPEEFLSFQAQDLSKLGFMQDLVRGIDKIMGKDVAAPKAETKIIQTDVNVSALLKRAEILIGDSNYEKADGLLERVLDNDPTNSQAYLLKLVIELKLTSVNDLKNQANTLEKYSNFQKAYNFADEAQRKKINSINEYINNRNEEARLGRLYDIAIEYKNNKQYGEAEKAFSDIAGYKDATKQAAECVNLGKEDIYKRALTHKERKEYDEAIETFNKIVDFKDSKDQIAQCEELKKSDLYKKALFLKEQGKFDEATNVFMQILNYNDSDFQVDECARLKTEAQKEAVYKSCLFEKEINPYFDSAKLKTSIQSLATIPGYKDADQLLVKYEGILKDYEAELAKKKEEKKRVRAKKKKKAKKISIIAGSVAAVFTGIMLLTFLYLIPENRQGKIQNAIDQKDYENAHSLINENGTYGDTNNLLSMCKAGEAFETLDYETGIDYIYNIGGSVDVTYDTNGGTTDKASETIKKLAYIDNDSEKPGYRFYGWKQTSYSLESKNHYATITLQAQYDVITYTLSFDLNGGSYSGKLPSAYNTEHAITLPKPTRTGYTFTGWTGSNGNTPVVDYTLSEGSIGNKTYKANWKANDYTIHLDANGGVVSSETISATYDSKYWLPTPSYSGYTFLGWYNSSNEEIRNGGTYKYTSDIYLTAKWQINTYTIYYDLQGGANNAQNPTSYVVTDGFVLKNPYREGYTFTGWTSSSVNTPTIGLEVSKGTTGDLSFKANWVANNYVITVNLNGGQMDKTSFDVTFDSQYEITEPTRAGYDFVCYLDENDNEFSSSGIYTIAGNISLTAKWEERDDTVYKINYYLEDLDGENYTLDFTDNKYGVSDKTITINAKDYEGFTPKETSKTVTINADGSLVVDFYYTRNTYTLSFVTNGGSAVEDKTLKYQETISDTIVTTRSGYTFDGWYQEAGQINKFETMPANNATVYAYYKEETKACYFDVTYSNGRATIAKANGLSGEVVVPLYIDDTPVCAIGENAFNGLSGITSISLPNTVDELGAYAFKDCTGVEKITGTSNVTIINDGTFENCRVLSVFPDLNNVISIGNNAFKDCVSLTTIKISSSLTSIGDHAFSGCASLLATPDLSGVTSIGDYAFSGCTSLTEINSLDGCATFGEAVFAACENIAKLTVQFRESVEQFYVSRLFGGSDGLSENEKFYAVSGPEGATYYVPSTLKEVGYSGTGNIPSYFLSGMTGVTSFADSSASSGKIGDYAFYGCSGLGSFTMASPAVNEVGSHSFDGASKLSELPAFELTKIGDHAFSGCASLLATPDLSGVTSIGDYAFENVNVFTNLVLTNTLEYIGLGVFSGCPNIISVSLPFSGSDSDDIGAFAYVFGTKNYIGSYAATEKGVTYYVPAGLVSLTIRKGVIGEQSLANLTSLVDLTFGDDVSAIGSEALKGCNNLISLTTPFIGSGAAESEAKELSYTISSTGSYPWQLSGDYYQSTNKGVNSSSSEMTITFTNSGSFTFGYKVSSESNYDKLYISLNSISIVSGISGTSSSFVEKTIDVVANDVLTIKFTKDSSQASGDDRGYFKIIAANSSSSAKDNHQVLGYFFESKTKVSDSVSGSKSSSLAYDSLGLEEGFVEQWDSFDGGSTGTTGKNYLKGYYYAIPSSLTTINITKQTNIPVAAFQNVSSLTSINIPTDSTIINHALFRNCSSLVNLNGTGINVPDSVASIGDYAFSNDIAITKVNLGNGVVSIGNNAFKGNSSLVDLALSTSLNSIGLNAFEKCSVLTTIDLPSSLLSIGEKAFYNCGNLATITAADTLSLTSIGNSAFEGDTSLISIPNLPNVTTIGDATFKNCSALTDISGLSKLVSIGKEAFKSCLALANINDLESLETIGDSAFESCNSLNDIVLPDSVKTIGNSAFKNCQGLTNVHSFANVETIGNYAFYNCSKLLTLQTSEKLTSVGDYAFANCSSILSIPEYVSLASIGAHAFENCTLLSEINELNSLETISEQAFYNCSSLTKLDFNANVSIGNMAFAHCSSLEEVDIPFGSKDTFYTYFGSIDSFDNSISRTDGSGSTKYVPQGLIKVNIKSQGTGLAASAFYNCSQITSLTMDDGITSVGNNCFYGCTGLTKLEFTDSIASMSINSLSGCSNITEIVLPFIGTTPTSTDSITTVFGSTPSQLTKLTVLKGTIGSSSCTNLTSLTDLILADSVESVGEAAFAGCSSLTNLTMPKVYGAGDASKDGYSYSGSWTKSGSTFTLSGKIGTVDEAINVAFSGVVKISYKSSSPYSNDYFYVEVMKNGVSSGKTEQGTTEKTVSYSVKPGDVITFRYYCLDSNFKSYVATARVVTIAGEGSLGHLFGTSSYSGSYADTSNACEYYIPSSLRKVSITSQEAIPAYAFAGCSSLTTVEIPESATSIGDYAFYKCSALSSLNGESVISIPDSVESIGDYAFAECKAVTSLHTGESCSSIGVSAFQNCSLLSQTTISEGNSKIGKSAFQGCVSLLGLNLPSSTGIVSDYAFSGCSSLSSVSIADGSKLTQIGTCGFKGCSSLSSFKWSGSSSLASIGDYAFANCSSISNWGSESSGNLVVPSGVSKIGTHAFENAKLFTDVILADSVESVGEAAFAGCSSLTNLTMPKVYGAGDASKDGYSYSGSWTKSGSTFTLSGKIGTVDEAINVAFSGVVKISYKSSSPYSNDYFYVEVMKNGVSSGKTEQGTTEKTVSYSVKPGDVITFRYYCLDSNFKSYVATARVVTIAGEGSLGHLFGTSSYSGSYADTSNACEYYIPSSLRKVSITSQEAIPAYAFAGCSSLTTVEIPESATSIGDYAFYKCSALSSLNGESVISIPDSVESIGDCAFAECKAATKVSAAASIGSYAFNNDSCLTDLTLKEGCKSIGSYAFANCITLNKINSSVVGKAFFPDSLETIGENAFLNCNLLTDVSLGSSISSLSANAFKGSTNIDKLSLSVNGDGWSSGVSLASAFPDSISKIKNIIVSEGTKIPNSLFEDMTNVESITIPDTITVIGSNAFKGCISLKRINSDVDGTFNLPNGLKYIWQNAFKGCTGLTDAKLGTSLLTVGSSAFEDCTNLVSVELGDKVTLIGSSAFKNCAKIRRINSNENGTINVPETCLTLKQNCFEGLTLISTVNIHDSVTAIEDGILYGCTNLVNLKLPFIGKSINQGSVAYQNCFGFIFGYTTSSSSDAITGYIYSGNITSTIYYHYAVPASLKNVTVTIQTVIPDKAFYNCSMLSNIVLPNSVTSEGASAYYNCTATVSKTYVPTKSSPWDGVTTATSFHSGTGTEQDPFVIFDGNELSYLAQSVNNGNTYTNTYFILNNDINLNNKTFTMIGNDADHPFLGIINGHGYMISNFTITGTTQYVGLFGYFGGTLEHIGFVNGTVNSTVSGNSKYYASLIAYMTSTATVSNVYDACSITISGAYYAYAGGIAGYADGGTISNSWSKATVVAKDAVLFAYAGGIAGYVDSGTISYCLSSGDITANGSDLSYSRNGQIVGDKTASNVTIENCYRYSGATLTRFNTQGSVYNTDGTNGTALECTNALKTAWDSTKWNMDGSWPSLKRG